MLNLCMFDAEDKIEKQRAIRFLSRLNKKMVYLFNNKVLHFSSETFKEFATCSLAVTLLVSSQHIFADTRLQIPVISENTQFVNSLVIVHGCDDAVNGVTGAPVFEQNVVFPNGVDSTITVGGDRNGDLFLY
ncbi:MAG: hypothetical protein WAW61_18655 [Methylococcaceae bacterium]